MVKQKVFFITISFIFFLNLLVTVIKPYSSLYLSIIPQKFHPPVGIEGVTSYRFSKGEQLISVHSGDTIRQQSIKELNKDKSTTEKTYSKTFVASLKKASVLKKDGEIITRNRKIFLDAIYHSTNKNNDHELLHRYTLPAAKTIKGSLAVIASGSPNSYYHWMLEVLPRLELLRLSGLTYDSLYVPELRYPFQKATLASLKIAEDKLIEADKRTHIQADHLIITSLPTLAIEKGREAYRSMALPSWVVSFLREHFLASPTEEGSQDLKIYISREKAQKRRILNEKELIASLKTRGFSVLCLEDLKVEEQAALFNRASLIVAPHGAGLTNLVFAHENTKVIEIFHPEYLSDCFFHMTQLLKQEHDYTIAEKAFKTSYQKIWYQLTGKDQVKDVTVDLKQLLEKVDQSI
ncbi:MAG: DUF563 domain-containing protein [Chlamydiales bacterium]|nr:glycosyltransferase family 61 protein [Chlamydiales bacterium]NCF71810.1 DUF563 domain-containing protein [Chlamydiales bacterium]